MHDTVMDFVNRVVLPFDVQGKRVLEVGSYNVNGSVRPLIERYGPAVYIGTDMREGPGVDQVLAADQLEQTFGYSTFDLVLCTEVLEHVLDWRTAIQNMMHVLDVGGLLVLTTRSQGFPLHEFPGDYWRFEVADLARIFEGTRTRALEPDTLVAGAFIATQKMATVWLGLLDEVRVYAMPQPA